MLKLIHRFLVIAVVLLAAGAACAQTLEDYTIYKGGSSTNWKDVTSTTNLLGSTSGDGIVSAVQNIGFDFPFAGNVYTQFSVNSDGNLRLGGTVTGSGSYTNPFNSTNANENGPKINFFGCDGYFNSSIHYVHAQTFYTTNHEPFHVVEFCLGTWNSTTRNQQYKWQVQLFKNGKITVVFDPTAPAQAPAVSQQRGLCINSSDGWIVNSDNTVSHFTSGSTSSWPSGTWPTDRYYNFINRCAPPPYASQYLSPDDTWKTITSTTSTYSCHREFARISITKGGYYIFKTGCGDGATANFDTYLTLYDTNNNILTSDDDGCDGETNTNLSKIEFRAPYSGFAYLKVSGLSNSHGSYTLAYKESLPSIPDYNYAINPTTSWINHSSFTTSNINYRLYRVYVTSGESYTFSTGCGCSSATADFDTKLYLYNNSGTQITYNDDACGDNQRSKIEYTATYTGYVYLKVIGYSSSAYGNYTLAYKKGCPSIPEYQHTIIPTDSWSTRANTTTGVCNNAMIYRVSVDANYTYSFKTGGGDNATADFDTYLELYNSSGTMLAYDDDGAGSGLSKLSYTPTSSGYLYLKVKGYNNATGNYTLAYNKSCPEVPNYHFSITPSTSWKTHSSNTNGTASNCSNTKIYRVYLYSGTPYIFKTGDGDGATANSPLRLFLYNSSGTQIAEGNTIHDDNSERKLEFTPTSSGNYYLEVLGLGGYNVSYTLAYRHQCSTTIDFIDLPYSENFDHYTSSTTAKTNVKPTCWTLVKQDVSMTSEYQPMIYYSSTNAHSGKYSLILNKRGIYAMPEYTGDVKDLTLKMYLKQTQTKYQLQVGVVSDLNNPNSFTVVKTLNNSTTDHKLVTVNFSSYTGSGHYIAFRNILASGQTGDYSINYIDDLSLNAIPNSAACSLHVSDIFPIYTNNFDSYTTSTTPKTGIQPACWTLAHQDVTMTDEYKPMVYYSPDNSYSGNYSLILNKRCIYAMPYVDNPCHCFLRFQLKQPQEKYQLQVGIMTDLNNESTFFPLETFDNNNTDFNNVLIDLSEYKNIQGHYIAFRNILAPGNTGDYSINYIDNIVLDGYSNCTELYSSDLPYTNNFDYYTTSTTAKTGEKPYCWTLISQDVTMTEEYEPMIYYSSANAHSGNYSLILNKRGIYAMPDYYGDISELRLDFYLKQPQTKYQLQVGVVVGRYNRFIPVTTINNSSTNYEHVTIDFHDSINEYVYNNIAFRNVLADGSTGDYSINYIDDLTLDIRPTTTCTPIQVADLPYTDNFDSYTTSHTAKTGVQPDCWTLAKQDVTMTDEYKPMIYYASANAHSGNYSLILNKRGIYAMPEFEGNVNTLTLSIYLKQPQTKYQLQVGVMTSLSNASSFTPVTTINNSGTDYVHRTIDFSSYTGSGHYIAFRNILASGQTGDYSLNYIDDLTLSVNTPSCTLHVADLPYTDNYDSYTTSTTAKTGVEPPCWTLAHQDVTMTNEYKPMVYYGSATAHSGNYSLILNKRGIYAMPYFDGTVNTLTLSMYLKQSQTKYQLQVGVMHD